MNEVIDLPTMAPTPKKSARKPQPGIGGLINLALMIWMIWDIRRRSDEELNGKRRWWMIAAFAPPIGPIVYFVYLRRRQVQTTAAPLEIMD